MGNSIKTLHEFANSMTSEDYVNAVKALNCVAFERKNNTKRKPRKDSKYNESSLFFSENPSVMNLNDDLFTLNSDEASLFKGKSNEDYTTIITSTFASSSASSSDGNNIKSIRQRKKKKAIKLY